ncbi:MAG: hypothetical protein QG665_335 [Patescibacteria group bacterium]|nr:hypothetical protein [Patescibacteria group bacterium]
MSTHKTTVDEKVVLDFLQENFSNQISNFEVIVGGEGSQAYSFNVLADQYVIRVNKHWTRGFKKDERSFTYFASPSLPIPKVIKIGKINENLRFCLSQKVEGKILNEFSSAELVQLLPQLFQVLDIIHTIDISQTKGYGKWDAEGMGEKTSWKEYILSVDTYAKGEAGKPSLFETTFLEKDFWDKAYAILADLVKYCPEERFLVHGDYGFNNVLSDGNKVTGVIDWEGSIYGDFLFDIAWLSFWSYDLDYQNLYLEYSKNKGVEIQNFDERMLCYKLHIGLGSCSFFAYSGQEEKYKKAKDTIEKLLNLN